MEPVTVARRQRGMRTLRPARVLALAVFSLLLAACSGSVGAPGSTPTTTAPTSIHTAEAAADAVRAITPLFDGIEPKDPNLIGQGSYWEAVPLDATTPPSGWTVTYTVGWGDCQAGCIDKHSWTWTVAADGSTTFVGEEGSVMTSEMLASLQVASVTSGAGGRVSAGPVCPVERPGDTSCAPRAVDGAVLVVQGEDGSEVSRITTDGSGLFRIALAPGAYTLVPQTVEGLMGTAAPISFTVQQGAETWLDVSYDTGIR